MTTEQTKKTEAEIITIVGARLAFSRLHKAEQSRNAKGEPQGTAKFSCTLLLDPSNPAHQAQIIAVKLAAKKVCVAQWGEDPKLWPKANPATGMGGLILCFGNGNDLPKIYDGYKDHFYIKCADTTRPLLGNRAGQPVIEGDAQCPYSGCIVRARISPWVYYPTAKRPQSANGVNMNIRSVQFMEDGKAFGGGGSRSADEEFDTSMAGDAKDSSEEIPF